MSKIFISHASDDNAKVLAVSKWLEQNGWDDVFLDIVPAKGLLVGERWQEALRTATNRCQIVLCLLSPAWRDSRECLAEYLLAKQLGKTIFGVLIEPVSRETLPKGMTDEWQLCDLVSGVEQEIFQVFLDQKVPLTQVSLAAAGLTSLKRGLEKSGLDPSLFSWPPPNEPDRSPYRGLKALEAEDAAVFFGREAPLIRALDTLRRMKESGEHLFVILGASGAGKSSFLRAGLWPRLKRDDRHFLPMPVVRPELAAISGHSGFLESLEKAYCQCKAPKTRAELRAILEKPDGIVDLITEVQTLAQKRLGPGAPPPTIVIGLDQAEELFTREGGEEASKLLELLGKLIGPTTIEIKNAVRPAPHVIIVATIRSDSYDQLQTASSLSGILQTPFSLPPLSLAEYKMVIEGPADRANAAGRGITIEPALTERLLEDADGADALPLLAFILERLFNEYGADGNLLLKEYEALGGIQGSIEAALKATWQDPQRRPVIPTDEEEQRSFLEQAFLSLVTLDHDSEKAKRRVAIWSTLPSECHPFLERLIAARLLLKDRRRLMDGKEDVVVELAHEALIRNWSLLQSWVDANREFMAWQQRLNVTRRRWERSQQPVGLLLRGLLLREALGWYKKYPDRLSPDERQFVIASRNRMTRENRVVAIGVSLVLALLSGTTWLWQKGYTVNQAILKAKSFFVDIHQEPEMVLVPGGTYQMGDIERTGDSWRNPVHSVTIKPFRIAKYEVTFEEYDQFAIAKGKLLPSDQAWGRGQRPVINVSWDDAKAYTQWLSKKTGQRYRLPTEAEWEYVARSGADHQEWAGMPEESQIENYAVYHGNSGQRTAEVGSKKANGFGLHDLSGNVWEWVEDCAHNDYDGAPVDGSAWLESDDGDCGRRVIRGGSWLTKLKGLWASNRDRYYAVNRNDSFGFRLAQDIP